MSDDYQDTFGSGDNGWISSDESGLHGHFQDSFSVESLRSFYYVSAIMEYSWIQTSQHAMKTQTDRTFNPFQASFAADFKEKKTSMLLKKNKLYNSVKPQQRRTFSEPMLSTITSTLIA